MLSISRKSSSSEQPDLTYLPDPRYGPADSFGWTQTASHSSLADLVRNHYRPSANSNPVEQACVPSNPEAHAAEPVRYSDSPLLPSFPFLGYKAGFLDKAGRSVRNYLSSSQTPRYPLHDFGWCVNGRLPCDAPKFQTQKKDEVMEDLTQPATQPFLDPRRQGTTSLLIEQDEADVLCILLPSSRTALKAVDLVAQTSPQHILQNHWHDDVQQHDHDLLHEATTSTTRQDSEDETTQVDTQRETQELEAHKSTRPSRDIALRMSSKVHNPCLGFVFGRNHHKCDLLVHTNIDSKLSNSHFRIFVNRHGVLMLEDTSTNGTYVDKVLLKSDKNNTGGEYQRTRTLNAGAIIELPTISRRDEEMIRFIVRFPSRDHLQEQYQQNLASYISYIQQQERRLQVAAAKNGEMPPPAPMPFNAMKDKSEASPNASILAAATGDYNHGFGWNGGEKYNVVSYIGKGAFAMVCKLSDKHNGEVYACKQIEKRRFIKDGVLNHKVHNEILVMKDLKHPNIVKYIEYHETKVHIFIIMEFISLGDLSVYTESTTAMPEYMCQVMASQIVEALDYLHARKITHRDIKPDNILVASQTPPIFKLSDFGLSKIINNEETFLKSFCGTLLYCAPEIYPGWQRAKQGYHPSKRTRSWEPRKGTLPYEHSVDTWSIAAVLFHLLCGHAPYTGSMEDEGAMMLINIMKTMPNWERLEQAGISPSGIDFIRRTLVIDPAERIKEAEMLRHPWLTGAELEPDQMFLQLGGDGADDLDASQLSLMEPNVPRHIQHTHHMQGCETPEDEDEIIREAKRSRYHENSSPQEPTNLFGSLGEFGSPGDDQFLASLLARDWKGQTLGNAIHQTQQHIQVPQTNRLFGEIGSSALRSSGVLGNNVHAALEVPEAGSDDPPSVDSSMMDSEVLSAESVSYVSQPLASDQFEDTGISPEQHPLQYPQLLPNNPYAGPGPAASLLGAEEHLDQLHMASPGSGPSWSSLGSKPVTPKTPATREPSPDVSSSKHTPTVSKSPQSQITPRMTKTASNDHSLTQAHINKSNLSSQLQAQGLTDDSETPVQDDGQRVGRASQSDASLLATAFNSQRSIPEDQTESQSHQSLQNPTISASPHLPVNVAQSSIPTSRPPSSGLPTLMVPTQQRSDPADSPFTKPPIRFGNLRPTPGSVHSPHIKITKQATTFGRDARSDYVHTNIKQERVPKRAIDINMWYRGMEEDLEAGKLDWQSHPSLTAIISTRTSLYIKVNGTRLMRGQGCWLYGKLKSGDVITVFEPPEGVPESKQKDKTFLKFECEFFIGKSKERRMDNEQFLVEKEELKYREYEARRSKENSFAQPEAQTEPDVAAGKTQP